MARAQAPSTGSTGAADGICNEQLPNDSVYNRFLYVVRTLAANGFYVLIDDHLSFDATAATNPAQWVAYWAQLLRDLVADPVTAGRVMVDLLNEPDARGLRCAAPPAPPCLPVSARVSPWQQAQRACRVVAHGVSTSRLDVLIMREHAGQLRGKRPERGKRP